MEHKFTAGWLG